MNGVGLLARLEDRCNSGGCNEVAFPRYSYSYDRTQAGLDSDRVRISSGLALTQLSLLRVFKLAVP
jgi:hypothetical protein